MTLNMEYTADKARQDLINVIEEDVKKKLEELQKEIEAAAKRGAKEYTITLRDDRDIFLMSELEHPLERGGYHVDKVFREYKNIDSFVIYTISWD